MFWEIVLFQSHSTANLLILEIFKNSKFFPKNPFSFFWKKKILTVLRNLTISVALYGKFATIWWKKIQTREQPMLVRLRELNWETTG